VVEQITKDEVGRRRDCQIGVFSATEWAADVVFVAVALSHLYFFLNALGTTGVRARENRPVVEQEAANVASRLLQYRIAAAVFEFAVAHSKKLFFLHALLEKKNPEEEEKKKCLVSAPWSTNNCFLM